MTSFLYTLEIPQTDVALAAVGGDEVTDRGVAVEAEVDCDDCETPGDSVMTSFLYTLEIPQSDVAEVRIVQEFLDVFQEIEGLPPRCVIEFRIDLVPGAVPISKAAYRLALKVLEEMKKQLDDLL